MLYNIIHECKYSKDCVLNINYVLSEDFFKKKGIYHFASNAIKGEWISNNSYKNNLYIIQKILKILSLYPPICDKKLKNFKIKIYEDN